MQAKENFSCEAFGIMRHDEITKIVREDRLITYFGESLHERHGSRQANDIPQRMRQLARLLRQVNSMHEGQRPVCLDQCLCGDKFDDVVAAAQALCVLVY